MRVPLRCQAEGRSAVPSEIKMRLHSGRKQRELTWLREHKPRDDQQDRKKKILTLLIPVTMRVPLRCEVDGRSAVPSEITMCLHRGRKQREVTWLREHKTRDDQQERKGRDADFALKVQHTKQKG